MTNLTFASFSFNAQQTPVSTQFDDIYFSTHNGLAESHYVFQEGNQIKEKWLNHNQSYFIVAETGFGTGLNFFALAESFRQFRAQYPHHRLKRLYFISFEKYPLSVEQIIEVHQSHPQFNVFIQTLIAYWTPRITGCQRYHFGEIYLDIWFGDILDNLPQLGDYYNETVDCWFLDGFSPNKNPAMWSEKLYQEMFRLTKNNGSFATFTAASAVRKGLQAVGFDVKKRKGFAHKREMLWGEKFVDNEEKEKSAIQYPYFYQSIASMHNDDIAIVGGGVASLFLALSLLERGKKVTLYCKDSEVAQNASGNSQGAIYPQLSDDDQRNIRFYIHSFDYALQRLTQLSAKIAFEHQFTGVALCAYNDKTLQKFARIAQQYGGNGLFELCDKTQLNQRLGIEQPWNGAFIPQGGWLSPIQLVKNGFQFLTTLGLKIELNHEVKNIEWKNNAWQWENNNQCFRHHIVVLANGHALTDFNQIQGIPLYPVRGQVSQIPTTADLQKLKCVLCYDGYLTPVSATGMHCIGASHVRNSTENSFSLEEHQQNWFKLKQNLTACEWTMQLDFSQNCAKVGIRGAFRDRMPMFGAVPDFRLQQQQYANLYNQLRRNEPVENTAIFPQLYLLAGLASRGLTTAPLLGEMLASQICNEPLPLSQELIFALAPNRSWIRKMRKGK